ncbi:hypothetical protein F5B22DRAFT_636473 [Xylaria bambusicola]|uniref:uncharacterized protein n=1 Tax=Xylaria bambusicola TaxID=326684 RepID=UPI0020087784|nr:uncharacterized protein F5B22DRAFT_636473 [Xylaria bambusicola]KAI0515446.1 hypothetical protein F5B22DRAFT_636473 [Xylaria bambusicola]
MEALENSMNNMQIDLRSVCCNQESDSPCTKTGTLACKNCLMVTYCSRRCQTEHYPLHREDCRSPIIKGTWKPRWVIENRLPAFNGPQAQVINQAAFGAIKYLWGNVPAIDVIKLDQNEGVNFGNPLNLLFAGILPQNYKSPLCIVINDFELDVVARNLIFILIIFMEEDANAAAEFMLHVWYSVLVTESCYTLLQKKLKPLINDVCNEISGRPLKSLQAKTWHFGSSSLRLVLARQAWMKLLSYLDVPDAMTKETAHAVHQAVVSAPSRIDYVDRAVLLRSPTLGLGMIKYRNDGILIPFGQSRKAFVKPNPTVFDSSQKWPMKDSADPIDGWSMKTVLETKAGPAKQDAYGQLYHYLRRLFVDFHQYLHSKPVAFELHHVDARGLDKTLAGREFDRIEVSNICDAGYLGIDKTLKTFGPLLCKPQVNPHATLITTFLNAVLEAKMMCQQMNPILEDLIFRIEVVTAMEYMKSELPRPTGTRAEIEERLAIYAIMAASAAEVVRDMDKYFDIYMDKHGFAGAASSAELMMKEKHTIIPPWPLRVNGGSLPTRNDKKDFKLLLGTGHTGQERYVEWKVRAVEPAANAECMPS